MARAQGAHGQHSRAQHSTAPWVWSHPAPRHGWGRSEGQAPTLPGTARISLARIHWELGQGTGQDKATASLVPRSLSYDCAKGQPWQVGSGYL